MKRLIAALSMLLLAVLLTACGNDSKPAPLAQTKAAFLSDVSGSGRQINIIKNDGTGLTPVGTPGDYYTVSISTDGAKIAVAMAGEMTTDIAVIKADGTGLTKVTPADVLWAYYPRFSPDGTKLMFVGYTGTGNGDDLMEMNADGTGFVNHSNNDGWCYHVAAYSPDGTQAVVYRHTVSGTAAARLRSHRPVAHTTYDAGLYLITLSTMQATKLTSDTSNSEDYWPAFSADGKTIFFTRWLYSSSWNPNIYSIKTDGTGLTQLTTTNSDYTPVVIGSKVLFSSERNDPNNWQSAEIYAMSTDGTTQTRLTTNSVWDGFDWD